MLAFGFLLLLLLGKSLAEEDPEPVFRAVGDELEMGFCFAVDYIAGYRITEGGKQLLGNSSDASILPPEEYKDRVAFPNPELIGLFGWKILNLKRSDSGIYLRECWRNNKAVNQHKLYLYVCDKEVSAQEIVLLEDGSADLHCNITHSGPDVSIKWLRPGNLMPLLLDTKMSKEPLTEELKDLIQVYNQGFSLHISEVKMNDGFYCLLMKEQQCKSFQHLYLNQLIDEPTILSLFYGVGEKAVLACSSEHISEGQKVWETPMGLVNMKLSALSVDSEYWSEGSDMYMSDSEKNYSLVIPSITLDHNGVYSCISIFKEVEYYITVCSHVMTNVIYSSPGSKVNLGCPATDFEEVNILWYRLKHPEAELIYDSGDPTLSVPDDVRDRIHILEEQHSLVISELTENDSCTYWCVVLLDSVQYPENTEEVPDDEEEQDADINEDLRWAEREDDEDKCIFKQVTHLKVQGHIEETTNPAVKTGPESESSPPLYAIIGAVAGILMLALIVTAVVVVKKRTKRKDVTHTELKTRQKSTSEPLI